MSKMLFFHENFILGGDTVYLANILKGVRPEDFMLIYGGSRSVTEHIENRGFNSSSLLKFNSYAESFFIFAANNKKFIIKLFLRILTKLFGPLLNLILRIRFNKFLQALRIDEFDKIIINSGGFYGTECSRLLLKAAKGKCIYLLHNHIPDETTNNPKEFSSIDKYVRNWVIGSKYIEKQLIDKCRVKRERMQVIPYGIKPSIDPLTVERSEVRAKLDIPQDAYVILHPSVFEKRKGHYYTLHAFCDLKKQISSAKLILAGSDGTHRNMIKEMVNELGIRDDVIYTGFYSPLEELIVASDVLCLPCQRSDTTPFVVLLALACRVPVLTTQREDFEGTLFDEQNALLVPTGNYEAITKKLIKLYNDDSLRKRVVEKGWQTYNEVFSEEKMVNSTINFFKSCW